MKLPGRRLKKKVKPEQPAAPEKKQNAPPKKLEPGKKPGEDKEEPELDPKELEEKIHAELTALLNERASAPLGGLVGVPLVNVLEVNLALRDTYGPLVKKAK